MKEMNNSGFTLIEILVSLVVVVVSMQILLGLILTFNRPESNHQVGDKEVLLIKQLERDLILCRKINKLNPFHCTTYIDEAISYEISNNKLVRKINGRGYEVIYPQIDSYYVENNSKMMWYITTEKVTHELLIGVANE